MAERFKALTPAELRWLPCLEFHCDSRIDENNYLYINNNSISSPVVVICLRFGAPGIKLARLRELINTRLISYHHSSKSSNSNQSSISDQELGYGLGKCRTKSSNISSLSSSSSADARSRLTQCLTHLSTGYAWRECAAFCLEEHVVSVPSSMFVNSSNRQTDDKSHTDLLFHSNKKTNFENKHLASLQMSNIETLVNELSNIPLRFDRPLWKAHLVERFYDVSFVLKFIFVILVNMKFFNYFTIVYVLIINII